MPKLTTATPKISREHSTAVVYLDGQRIRLGRYGSAEAQEAYDRLIAEWLANGRRLPASTSEAPPEQATITVICVAYAKHAARRYSRGKVSTIKSAISIVRKLYGSTPAEAFGPKRLRVVREEFIAKGWARSYVNEQVRCIRSMFKWASSHELVDVRVHRALETVESLRKGEAMREGRKVKPIPRDQIRRVRRLLPLPLPVRGLVNLQLLTAARPGELVGLRPADIDMSGEVWTYCPEDHKTAHHEHDR